jgi:hypothetical protein
LRICITRLCAAQVEGVDLSQFELGKTYDLATSLATYLVVMQCAQPVAEEPRHSRFSEASGAALPREEKLFQGTTWPGWAVASDWLRRGRKRARTKVRFRPPVAVRDRRDR